MFHLPHSKKLETLKFEVTVTVQKLENLPAKYAHLRLTMTRGAKAVSTKEIFATNQRAEPRAADGVMKFVSTMYKMPGAGQGAIWEEKKFKLSLVRINPRALREKEKSIGYTYINLADFANPTGVSESLKLSMSVAEASLPAVLGLTIQMQWLKNYKGGDGDGASDISGLETNSVASSMHGSVEDEQDQDDLDDDDVPAPAPAPAGGGGGKPAAGRLSGGGGGGAEVAALKEQLEQAKADLQWTSESLKEAEAALDERGTAATALKEELKRCKEDLARERKERAEAQRRADEADDARARAVADLAAAGGGGGEGKGGGGGGKAEAATAALAEELERVKGELAKARKDRDEARRETESERGLRAAAEREAVAAAAEAGRRAAEADRALADARRSAAAAVPSPTAAKGGASTADLEAQLEKERAKAAKYKGYLEKVTEAKGALEAELDALRSGRPPPTPTADDSARPPAAAERPASASGDGGEVERISAMLIKASLGHAQAEQDRLEAKQQVYKLKEANRRLRERLTTIELSLAKAKSA